MLRRFLGKPAAPSGSLSALPEEDRQAYLRNASMGMELIMNDDVERATEVLQHHADAFHDTGKAVAVFLRAVLGFEKEEILASSTALNLALASCEEELKHAKHLPASRFPAGAEYDVCIGNILLQLALVGFMAESVPEAMRAVLKLRRAYNIFHALHQRMESTDIKLIEMDNNRTSEKAQLTRIDTEHMNRATGHHSQTKLNPTDYFIACGTLSGFGLLSLLISLIPPSVSRILSIIGFRGNRSQALKTLFAVADAPNIQGSIALLALLAYYNEVVAFSDVVIEVAQDMKRLDSALASASARYPNSAIWNLQRARLQQESGDVYGSITTLEGTSSDSQLRQINSLKMYNLGFAYIITMQWEKAAKQFILVEQANDWSKALYFYIIGSCYFEFHRECRDVSMLEMAEKYFSMVTQEIGKKKIMGKELPLEIFFRRKISKWKARSRDGTISGGITVSPIFEFGYAFNLPKKMSQELLRKALQSMQLSGAIADTVDDRASRALITGSMQRHMKDWKAFDTIASVATITRQDFRELEHAETWVLPFARYEYAVCYWQRDGVTRQSEVRSWLEQAKAFGESELEARLSLKLSTAFQTLDNLTKTTA